MTYENIENYFKCLINVPEKQLLDFLNNQVLSSITDDPCFLRQFGDYTKIEDEVISCYEYERRQFERRQQGRTFLGTTGI